MLGLLRKDLYLTASMARSYLIICAFFIVLTVLRVYDASFLATFLSLICIMLPVNVSAYDEQARWDKFASALPTGRDGAVQARYLFTALICLGAVVLAAVLAAAIWLLDLGGPSTLGDALLTGVLPASFGFLVNAILLPLLFKFGSQKGRLYLVVAIAVFMGCVFGALGALSQAGVYLTSLPPLWLLPPLCLLTLYPSYCISRAIFRRKEF